MTASLRFSRQVRLAEVGEDGQARLVGVVVSMASVASDGLAGAVEERYLRGAGLRTAPAAEPASVVGAPKEEPAWLTELEPAARDVARGAYGALGIVRAVLAGQPHPRVTRTTDPLE